MAVSKDTLEKHLIQVRRIAEHREAKAEQNIRYYFSVLKKDLNSFLGNEYAKYAEDDKLTYAILQQKGEYARFLEEVISKVDGISPRIQTEVQSLIEETYKTCYAGMVKGVESIEEVSQLAKQFKAVASISPETVKRAVRNPINKLTLTAVLEKNRKNIVSSIRREIAIGLTQGDRMSTMANRISKHVGQNYRKSMLIARTEAHRVRESGFNDAADEIDNILTDNDSEYRMVKIWRNMRDAAVRHTNLANHVEMEGVAVLQDEDFELSDGSHAPCPGSSGIAAQDCNCRCFLARRIMNDEEYYQFSGKHFSAKAFTNPEKRDIIKPETSDSADNNKAADTKEARENQFETLIKKQKGLKKDFRQEMQTAFVQGSETAQKAFLKYAKASSVKDAASTNGAYFSPGTKKVFFNAANLMNDPRGAATTYFHEFGHLVDFCSLSGRGKWTSIKNKKFSKALHDDFDTLIKSYTSKGLTQHDAYRAISAELMRDPHITNQVSDLIGGITGTACQGMYGHSSGYWQTAGALEQEAFAHMFEVQFDPARYAYMQKYFPSALKTFEVMLGGIV